MATFRLLVKADTLEEFLGKLADIRAKLENGASWNEDPESWDLTELVSTHEENL